MKPVPGDSNPDSEEKRLLLICHEDQIASRILKILEKISVEPYAVERAMIFGQVFKAVANPSFHICLIVESTDPNQALSFLHTSLLKQRDIPIILLSHMDPDAGTVEAFRLGAADFISLNQLDATVLERSLRYALERKRARDAVRESEDFFRVVIENNQDGISVIDPNGKVRYTSSSLSRILGYSPEERIGKYTFDVLHPDDMNWIQEAFKGLLQNPGSVQKGQVRARHKDGAWRYLDLAAKSHYFSQYSSLAVVLNYRDVTDRVKAQQVTERLASIVDSSHDAIYTLSREGVIFSWNPRAREIYGFPPEEISGRHFSLIMDQDESNRFQTTLEEVFEGRGPNSFQTTHRSKVGKLISVSLVLSPIRDSKGQINRVSVIARDISPEYKLMEIGKRLSSLLENAPTAIYSGDKEGVITMWSRGAEKIFGYKAEEMIGQKTDILEVPENPGEIAKLRKEVNDGKAHIHYETVRRRKDGSRVNMIFQIFPALDANGKNVGVTAIGEDVTSRMIAERALNESEARLRDIFEKSPLGMALTTTSGLLRIVNPKFCQMLGYEPSELIDRPIMEISYPQDLPREVEGMRNLIQGKIGYLELDKRYLHKRGHWIWTHLVASMLTPEKSEDNLVLGMVEDITDRVFAKRALEESEARFKQIFHESPIGMGLVRQDGIVLMINPKFCQLLGYNESELIGRNYFEFISPDELKEAKDNLAAMYRGDRHSYSVERRYRRRDGQWFWGHMEVTRMKTAEGAPLLAFGMLEDISERKKSQETREFLVNVLENTGEAVITADLNGTLLSWNKAAETLYGFTAAEAIGKKARDLMPEGKAREIQALMDRFIQGEKIKNHEMIRLKNNGEPFYASITFSLLKDERGAKKGITMVIRDVSEMKKARKSQDRLANILEHSYDAILGIDMEGVITHWNIGAETMFGYTASEAHGQNIQLLVPEEYRSETRYLMEKAVKGESVGNFETVRRRKNGSLIDVSLNVSPFKDDSGKVTAVSAILRDITETKKARETRERLADILENSPIAITTTNLERKFIQFNHAAENLYGYKAEEMLGKTHRTLVPEDHWQQHLEVRENVLQGQSVVHFESVRRRKDGQPIAVSSTLIPYRDSEGKIMGVTAMSVDITEQKKAAETLNRKEEQIKLAQKMEAIGRLAGGVAHDFNNLLSIIGGNANFVLDDPAFEGPHREELEEIKKAVQQGSDLTRQLLLLGQKQISQAQPIQLNDLCREMMKMSKRLVDASIEITLDLEKDLHPIFADLIQIQQVILNLVLNARDAMPRGGNLRIQTRNEVSEGQPFLSEYASWVKLTVTDTGVGMDAQVQKHIFEPFYTTKGAKGTGLGLTTVYGIVKQWKGQVQIESAVGQGTSFFIYFPAHESVEKQPGLSRQVSLIPNGSETILVVEDEPSVRQIVVKSLRKWGYKVLEAENGVDAVRESWNYKGEIHLLLTDTVMPKMDGFQLAEELRNTRPRMKVLFMSGYPRDILSSKGILNPDIFLVRKPFAKDELAQQIRQLLDQKKK